MKLHSTLFVISNSVHFSLNYCPITLDSLSRSVCLSSFLSRQPSFMFLTLKTWNFSQLLVIVHNFEYVIFKILCSVQSLSRVRLFATPWIAAHQASLSITNSQSSFKLTSIESVMPSNHLILCRPLLLLPPTPPSISLFQWVNSSHEVAKVLEFQL